MKQDEQTIERRRRPTQNATCPQRWQRVNIRHREDRHSVRCSGVIAGC